jgi:ligand-binding sensor domain-containing protein
MKTKLLFSRFLSILLILFAFTTNAQVIFTNYTTSNGLPDNFVNGGVAVDTNNNIWVGTIAGVAKYNHVNWTTYTTTDGLVDNYVTCIAVDKNNNVWVGTQSGVSKFNGTMWTNYTSTDGLIDNAVNYIAGDIDGSVWFATFTGVSKFNGTTWTNYTTANGMTTNEITFITVDKLGNKWLGTQMKGIMKYNNTTFDSILKINADSLLDDNVFAIALDTNGNKWIGTWYGMSEFNNSGSWVANFRTGNGLYNNFVRDIDIDSKGKMWIGLYADYNLDGGITRYNGNTWTSYTETDGLADAQVVRMAIDKHDNLWVATGGGVSKVTDLSNIQSYEKNSTFYVYPNPTKDFVNINLTGLKDKSSQKLSVFNTLGQKVAEYLVPENTDIYSVSMKNLVNGLYFIKFQGTTSIFEVKK